MRLILASGSKQRQDIFKMIGWKYEVITSKEEEKSSKENPNEYVEELSKIKANSVEKQIEGKALIVAADSIIYMNGKKYEKPKSKEEAFKNIKEMSGKSTYAVTGITIKDLYKNREINDYHHAKDAFITSIVGSYVLNRFPSLEKEFVYNEYKAYSKYYS